MKKYGIFEVVMAVYAVVFTIVVLALMAWTLVSPTKYPMYTGYSERYVDEYVELYEVSYDDR